MSRRVWIPLVVVVVLIAAAVAGGLLLHKHQQEQAQRAAVVQFAQAWQSGRLASLRYADAQPSAVAADVQKITAGLTDAAQDNPSQVIVTSQTPAKDHRLTANLQVSWTLRGGRGWRYETVVPFRKTNGAWLADYQPGIVQPKLVAGAVLTAVSKPAARGEILGAHDQVLVTERPVVLVGLEPSRADDVEQSAQQIADVTGIDGAGLAKRAKAAGKDSFVLAISLRRAAYDQVRDQLQPIPGAVFQETTLSLAPTTEFARALLGSVGPATAEAVKESGGRIRPGDLTGLSGVQQEYDKQLSGTPGLTVQMVTPAAKSTAPNTPATRQTLFGADPVAGKPLHLTLDGTVQQAADQALQAATKPAALVAIQVSTGNVLAVANGGPNAAGYNRALLGRYPPGSTFKVATTLGLLGVGITPSSTINCPPTFDVGGRKFQNAEHEHLGAVPFREDFANSCNTAFVSTSPKLSAAALAKAAGSLGYGRPNQLGVTAFTGSVPTSGDAVAHAAAMIGQGTVLASPVTVAGATAAVASGKYLPPQLVLDGGPAPAVTALPAGPDRDLKDLMRAVVTNGTATGLRSVPGGPVSGKTGTAQYGKDHPPQTHAWFTGFQGDVAFAVLVEGGGFGAKAAVPLVKDFLTQLAD